MISSTDFIKPSGIVRLTLLDRYGHTKFETTVPNLVVRTGLSHIALRMSTYWLTPVNGVLPDTIANEMSHMALGSSATEPTASDTQLGAQLGNRVALTPAGNGAKATIAIPTGGPATVTFSGLFPAGTATGNVTEAGIFNALTSGTMLCRTTFPVISKLSTDSLAISWTITIS